MDCKAQHHTQVKLTLYSHTTRWTTSKDQACMYYRQTKVSSHTAHMKASHWHILETKEDHAKALPWEIPPNTPNQNIYHSALQYKLNTCDSQFLKTSYSKIKWSKESNTFLKSRKAIFCHICRHRIAFTIMSIGFLEIM